MDQDWEYERLVPPLRVLLEELAFGKRRANDQPSGAVQRYRGEGPDDGRTQTVGEVIHQVLHRAKRTARAAAVHHEGARVHNVGLVDDAADRQVFG